MNVLASDDFNRADQVGIGGTGWASTSPFDIVGNRVSAPIRTSTRNYRDIDFPVNQWSQATVKVIADATWCAVTVRQALALQTSYAGGFNSLDFGNINRRIWKEISGTGVRTSLATEAIDIAVDDVISIQAIGTTIKLFVNGVERLSATDASITTQRTGMLGRTAVGGTPQFDDWSGGDFVGELGEGQMFHGHLYIGIDI